MAIIIDGYNLLHAANIVAEGLGKYSLEKSRRSVLRAVAALLSAKERGSTTVVFDGKDAPPGLTKVAEFAGMTVLFSEPGTEADDLIEELIQSSTVPRRLTVVSGDHRLHRAARRRQATAIDSDVWYQQRYRDRQRKRERGASPNPDQNDKKLSKEEVADWMDEFGPIDVSGVDADDTDGKSDRKSASPRQQLDDEFFNPFPDGYGEDLL